MKKQSLSILIVIIVINILLPFSIILNNDSTNSFQTNVIFAETKLEIAERELLNAHKNLDTINKLIKNKVVEIDIARANNEDVTQLESILTNLNGPVWAAANKVVREAEKKVFYEKTLVSSDKPKDIKSLSNIEYTEDYTLLAPLGGRKQIKTNDIGNYFNIIFNIAIGIAGVLAVIMLVIGGIQWMGSESVFGKTNGKEKITSAILGLLIAIGSYSLLNTINPDLLGKKGLNVDQVNIKLEGDTNAPVDVTIADLINLGITCGEVGGTSGFQNIPTIARSFKNKMTYSQNIPKGQIGPNNTVKYDCSGYINAVLQCSGIETNRLGINSGTSVIFSIPKAETVVDKTKTTSTSVNGKLLQIGDLVGWPPVADKDGNGHIMIYLGGGMVSDSHGPRDSVGNAFGEFSLEKYKERITHIVRTQAL